MVLLYFEELVFSCKKNTDNNSTQSPLCCGNEGHGFFHSRKSNSRCLINALAFSAWNQAHNLTNIFHANAFSNMLLQGSSARVLQCSPFPTGTGAVLNSFSKQSCLHTNCSLLPYLCPVGCFREILFKQTRNCHWNPLPGRMKVPDFLSIQEWNSVMYILGQFEKQFSHNILNVNTGNGI